MTWEQLRVCLLLLFGMAMAGVAIVVVGRTGNVFGERYQTVAEVPRRKNPPPAAEPSRTSAFIRNGNDCRDPGPVVCPR